MELQDFYATEDAKKDVKFTSDFIENSLKEDCPNFRINTTYCGNRSFIDISEKYGDYVVIVSILDIHSNKAMFQTKAHSLEVELFHGGRDCQNETELYSTVLNDADNEQYAAMINNIKKIITEKY